MYWQTYCLFVSMSYHLSLGLALRSMLLYSLYFLFSYIPELLSKKKSIYILRNFQIFYWTNREKLGQIWTLTHVETIDMCAQAAALPLVQAGYQSCFLISLFSVAWPSRPDSFWGQRGSYLREQQTCPTSLYSLHLFLSSPFPSRLFLSPRAPSWCIRPGGLCE